MMLSLEGLNVSAFTAEDNVTSILPRDRSSTQDTILGSVERKATVGTELAVGLGLGLGVGTKVGRAVGAPGR